MTKDLALLISNDAPWLNTQEFLAAIDENLQKEMKQEKLGNKKAPGYGGFFNAF